MSITAFQENGTAASILVKDLGVRNKNKEENPSGTRGGNDDDRSGSTGHPSPGRTAVPLVSSRASASDEACVCV